MCRTIECLLILSFLLNFTKVFAQHENCLHCVENPNHAEIPKSCCANQLIKSDSINKIIDDLYQQNDFHNTLQVIREPTTASGLWTNYNWVIDGYQKNPFILDADVNFPIAVRAPIKGLYSSVHFIPKFKFRIFKNDESVPFGIGDVSRPVRTPSAMPGIAWYFTPKSWWHRTDNVDTFKDKYFGIHLFHHSNGQDGVELDTVKLGEINTYNGNFSENLVVKFVFGGRRISPTDYSSFGKKNISKVKTGEIIDVYYSNKLELHYTIG